MTATWSSRAPLVLDELFTLATTALASDTCVVLQGPVVTAGTQPTALIVGWEPQDGLAAEHRFAEASFDVAPLIDRFDVYVLIKALAGTTDVSAATSAAYGLLAGLIQILADHPRPDGASLCRPVSAVLRRRQEGNGLVASLLVTLACTAETAAL